MTKQKVLEIVGERLKANTSDVEFQVLGEEAVKERSWWHVPVFASKNGVEIPRRTQIEIYAEVETEIEDEYKVTVLFIPASNPAKAVSSS